MTPLHIRTITKIFFQNNASQIYAEIIKDNITITIIYNIKNIIMLYLGDCFEIFPTINKKIDFVLVDLPYGQTHNKFILKLFLASKITLKISLK